MQYSFLKVIKYFRFQLVFFFLLLFLEPSFCSEIDIKANYLEYDEVNQFMLARDSVTVSWGDKILKAEEVKFWVDKKILHADTNVVLKEENNITFCDEFIYDYQVSTGIMYNATGSMEEWTFIAKKAVKKSTDTFKCRKMRFTSCDYKKPHYHIRATSAKIRLGKRITAYNPIFFFRNIPIFYLPIYSSGLGKTKHSLEIQPGYNSDDGLVLKVIYGYPLSENLYMKLYWDHFSKKGNGFGGEINYYIPDKIKTSLYAYYIKEAYYDVVTQTTTYNVRYILRGGYWQRISPLWTGQIELNYLSDSTFNSIYFQENWQKNNQSLNSHLSFTRQDSKTNIRILASSYDTYNIETNQFETQTLTIPRTEFTLFTQKWDKLSIYYSINGYLQNQYSKALNCYIISGLFDSSIYRDIRLNRNLTLTPKIGFSENWQDKSSLDNLEDIFVARLYNNNNLRCRVTNWVDWDFGYNYRIRAQQNTTLIDIDANDYGIETNNTTFMNSMYLSRSLTLRNSTGYDFRINRDEIIDDWKTKFTPIIHELTWVPTYSMTVFVREESNFHPHYLKSIQTVSQFGVPEKEYLNLGVFYRGELPNQFDLSTGVGFWFTEKWKFEYDVKSTFLKKGSDIRVNDKMLKIYRDLHCWEFQVTYRQLRDYEEVYFQFNLKTSSKAKKKLYKIEEEKEFYPWRTK